MKSRSVHILEVTFTQAPPPGAFALPGVTELHRDGNVVHLQARDGIDALLKAITRYTVVDVRTEQPSLEDVFLAYYAGGTPEAVAEEERKYASA
jgi:ABC-2 type transport system ATP-binding protein